MPRARSPNRKKAFMLWQRSNGKKKNKDIAAELGVSEKLISRWKKEDKWEATSTTGKSRKSTNQKSTKRVDSRKDKHEVKAYQLMAKVVDENDDLNENQKLFILYWMRSRNATQSYFRTHNCSYATAMVEGCKSLRIPKIQREIARMKAIRNETLFLDADDVVEKYMKIAFADVTNFAVIKNNKMYVMNSDMLDGGLISEVKQTKSGVGIKLEDRMKALQWLSDYFNLNPRDQHKQRYDDALLKLREKEMAEKDW
jgi:phage terminase small subunit